MIKTVRQKFILISTLALVIVLATIIGSISVASFYRNNQEVDKVLNILVKNNGQIDRSTNIRQPPTWMQPHQSREGIFQYRFFSSQLDAQGNVTAINDSHIETVPDRAIVNLSERAFRRGRQRGTIRYHQTSYAYQVKHFQNRTTIVFLDQTILMEESYGLLKIAVLFGLISMVLYTAILVFLSKRAIQPLVVADQRQREFISKAGHELKTPLTVISANTEMQELTSGETEWTKSNKDQISRLTRLINNLISLTRLGEQPNLQLEQSNISQITRDTYQSFKNVMTQNHLQLSDNIEDNVLAMVDKNYYAELINILLDNANKYCDKGGEVAIELHRSKRRTVVLDISNSYAKGTETDYRKFFERFYREDTAHQAKGGFGIGLSMAQRIVSDFDGSIQAKYANHKLHLLVTLKQA